MRIDHVWSRVECPDWVAAQLYEAFTHEVPGHEHDRRFRAGVWDGKRHLFSPDGTIYTGLYARVVQCCEVLGVPCASDLYREVIDEPTEDLDRDLESANAGTGHGVRPYQRAIFKIAHVAQRALFVSPTGSGKSLSIYHVVKHRRERTLLIVPRKGLVRQMRSDFESYGWPVDDTHEIMEGADPNVDKPLIVSTYQSIHKLPSKWFDRFGLVIGDEAHMFQAKTLRQLMQKTRRCRYKYGFTGTIDDSLCHRDILEGLFGPLYTAAKTHELIDEGYLAKFRVQALVLKHPPAVVEALSGSYTDEIEAITESAERNRFVVELVSRLRGNTLVLVYKVKKHGHVLEKMMRDALPDRPVYYVHGGVEAEEREWIRLALQSDERAVYLATYGTLSTGVNIPRMHNLVFAHPFKAKILNLQSIGRVLRTHWSKDEAVLYDVADDLSRGGEMNHTLDHHVSRVALYGREKFPYEVHTIKLTDCST